jgi:hypothetical protein
MAGSAPHAKSTATQIGPAVIGANSIVITTAI